MSNEELVARIQDGEEGLYGELWANVERLVYWKARQAIHAIGSSCGVEVEDLLNCGYFALVKAVGTYSPGAHSFAGWLMLYLKTEFAEASGYRTEKRKNDPLQHAVSLSAPLAGDSEDLLLSDTIPDPNGQAPMESIEDSMWHEQLHDALECILEEIPANQSDVIRHRYYQGLTVATTAQALGTSYTEARKLEGKAIRTLRQPKIARKIRPFYDFDYYSGTGLGTFRSTGMSIQERYLVNKYDRSAQKTP